MRCVIPRCWHLFRLVAPVCLPLAATQAAGAQVSGAKGEDLAAPASLEVTVSGFSSSKGTVRLAVCPASARFPDCGEDAVRTAAVQIDHQSARARFEGLPEGAYAISAFHDANGNGRLDTFLGIPREGFGFSRNPAFRPRAPRFSEAEILVRQTSATNIALRYLF